MDDVFVNHNGIIVTWSGLYCTVLHRTVVKASQARAGAGYLKLGGRTSRAGGTLIDRVVWCGASWAVLGRRKCFSSLLYFTRTVTFTVFVLIF